MGGGPYDSSGRPLPAPSPSPHMQDARVRAQRLIAQYRAFNQALRALFHAEETHRLSLARLQQLNLGRDPVWLAAGTTLQAIARDDFTTERQLSAYLRNALQSATVSRDMQRAFQASEATLRDLRSAQQQADAEIRRLERLL